MTFLIFASVGPSAIKKIDAKRSPTEINKVFSDRADLVWVSIQEEGREIYAVGKKGLSQGGHEMSCRASAALPGFAPSYYGSFNGIFVMEEVEGARLDKVDMSILPCRTHYAWSWVDACFRGMLKAYQAGMVYSDFMLEQFLVECDGKIKFEQRDFHQAWHVFIFSLFAFFLCKNQ